MADPHLGSGILSDDEREHAFRSKSTKRVTVLIYFVFVAVISAIGFVRSNQHIATEFDRTAAEKATCHRIATGQQNLTMPFVDGSCINRDDALCEIRPEGTSFILSFTQETLERLDSGIGSSFQNKPMLRFAVQFCIGLFFPILTRLIGYLCLAKWRRPQSFRDILIIHDQTQWCDTVECIAYFFFFVMVVALYSHDISSNSFNGTCEDEWLLLNCLRLAQGEVSRGWDVCRTTYKCFMTTRIASETVNLGVSIIMFVESLLFVMRLWLAQEDHPPENSRYSIFVLTTLAMFTGSWAVAWQSLIRYHPLQMLNIVFVLLRLLLVTRMIQPNINAIVDGKNGVFVRLMLRVMKTSELSQLSKKREYSSSSTADLKDLWHEVQQRLALGKKILFVQLAYESFMLLMVFTFVVIFSEGWNCFAGNMVSDYSCSDCSTEFIKIDGAFWFSISTLITVGYGDATPKTMLGRLGAVFVLICALIFMPDFVGYHAKNKLRTQVIEKRMDKHFSALERKHGKKEIEMAKTASRAAEMLQKQVPEGQDAELVAIMGLSASKFEPLTELEEIDEETSSYGQASKADTNAEVLAESLQNVDKKLETAAEAMNNTNESLRRLLVKRSKAQNVDSAD